MARTCRRFAIGNGATSHESPKPDRNRERCALVADDKGLLSAQQALLHRARCNQARGVANTRPPWKGTTHENQSTAPLFHPPRRDRLVTFRPIHRSRGHSLDRATARIQRGNLGMRLRVIPFDHVLTSPLQRAQQTCALAGLGARCLPSKRT